MANFPALVLSNQKSKNAGKAKYTTTSGTNLHDWTGTWIAVTSKATRPKTSPREKLKHASRVALPILTIVPKTEDSVPQNLCA